MLLSKACLHKGLYLAIAVLMSLLPPQVEGTASTVTIQQLLTGSVGAGLPLQP